MRRIFIVEFFLFPGGLVSTTAIITIIFLNNKQMTPWVMLFAITQIAGFKLLARNSTDGFGEIKMQFN